MKWTVSAAGEAIFDAASPEEAEEVVERIKAGNRWAGKNRITVEPHSGEPDPTPLRDKVFWWRTNISVGYAGWDCVPLRIADQECVLAKSGESKSAIVLAASAMDAIAKSELLMYTVKASAW